MAKKNNEIKNSVNSFSNSVKEMGSMGKGIKDKVVESAKALPNLPWSKLPKDRYIVLIIAFIAFIALFIFAVKFLI